MRRYPKVNECRMSRAFPSSCDIHSMCDLSDDWSGDFDYEDVLDEDEAIDDAEEL